MSADTRPLAERRANPRYSGREIACRSCGGWMRFDREFIRDPEGRWHHSDDGTLACVDPVTLAPYPEDEVDPICDGCGHAWSDHPLTQVVTPSGDDYETQICPNPEDEPRSDSPTN